MWMRCSRVSDSQCRNRNCPGFDPSILQHSGIWRAADEAGLKKVDIKNRIGRLKIGAQKLKQIETIARYKNWSLKPIDCISVRRTQFDLSPSAERWTADEWDHRTRTKKEGKTCFTVVELALPSVTLLQGKMINSAAHTGCHRPYSLKSEKSLSYLTERKWLSPLSLSLFF